MTKTPKKENQHLKTPVVLERIARVRERMQGTDRDDQLSEIDQWEATAKKNLILLSLRGHEGIDMIKDKAKAEMLKIKEKIQNERPSKMTEAGAIEYALNREFLFQQMDLWLWFLNIFTEAKEELQAVENQLDTQDALDTEEDGDNWG